MRAKSGGPSTHGQKQGASGDDVIDRGPAGKVGHRAGEALQHGADGLGAAPEAFLGLLKGRNFGKQLVKLV